MNTQMRKAIPLDKRIAIALHYLGSAEEIRVVAALFGVGHSTVHEIFYRFIYCIIDKLMYKTIKFPLSVEELERKAREFESLGTHSYIRCVGSMSCFISPPKIRLEAITISRVGTVQCFFQS